MLASFSTALKRLALSFGITFFAVSMTASNLLPKVTEIYGDEFRLSVIEAQKLHELAEDSFYKAEFRDGIRSLEEGLHIVEMSQGRSSSDVAILLTTMAEGWMSLGRMDTALDHLKRTSATIDEASEIGRKILARALKDEALIDLLQGGLGRAPVLLSRSLELQKTAYATGHPATGLTLQAYALSLFLAGDYPKAISEIEESSAIVRKAFGHENVVFGQNLNIQAMIQWKQGDFATSVSTCQRSLLILEKILPPDHPITGQSLNTLGLAYQGENKFKEALPVLKRSLGILEKHFGRDHLHVALNLKIQGLVNLGLGKNAEAIRCFERNLRIYDSIMEPETAPIATTLNNLALAHRELGNFGAAVGYLERCLSFLITQAGNEHPEVANALHNLAVVRDQQGEDRKALSLYQRSLDLTVRIYGTEHPKVAVSLESIANFLLKQGYIQTGADTLATMFNGRRPYLAQQYLASSANNALDAIERSFYSAELLHSTCSLGSGDEARQLRFIGAEQLALGKAFLEEMQAMKSSLEANPQTSTRETQARLNEVLARIENLPQAFPAIEQRDSVRVKIEEELLELETKLAERNALAAQTVRERRLILRDIAQNLPPGSVLVDFVSYRPTDFAKRTTGKSHYTAYLTFPLAKDSTNVVVERADLGEAAPINEAIERILNQLGMRQRDSKILRTELQRLSQSLYTPLTRHLTNVSHLIVCPDGQLSRVPFEMLLVSGRGEPPRYLVEEKTVSYVGSGREVVRLAQPLNRGKTTTPLVMGNPDFNLDVGSSRPGIFNMKSLEDAEKEARSVAALLGNGCRLRLGKEARESELKSVDSPQVLHLATHAEFQSDQVLKDRNPYFDDWKAGKLQHPHQSDWENPMLRCFIALAGVNHALRVTDSPTEDGLLTALEASLLNLQGTELVILSACESGAGEVKIGEGVMSLRRAFRIAGAETVLASHWKVDDEATSRLMTEFMRRWRAGEPRAKAWREAQLPLLRSEKFSNPYYWAAFTLTGQWR